MGMVYSAVEMELNRPVALKIVNSNRDFDDDLLARFEREAKVMSRLSHKNIVQIFRIGKFRDTPFIAMEVLQGESLRETILRKERLSVSETLRILAQVAEGVSAAHNAGIIHRDLKPANIFVLPDGTVKILDFGLCAVASSDDEVQKLTQTGALIGSVHYMSPEACQGRPLTERADIYSIGIVLYECLRGQPPFDAESPIGVLHRQKTDPIPEVEGAPPELFKRINRILRLCLAKNAEDRFSSAEELGLALRGALQDTQVNAAEVRIQSSQLQDPRWTRTLFAAGLVLFVVSICTVAFSYTPLLSSLLLKSVSLFGPDKVLSWTLALSENAGLFNGSERFDGLNEVALQIANEVEPARERVKLQADLSLWLAKHGALVQARTAAGEALASLRDTSPGGVNSEQLKTMQPLIAKIVPVARIYAKGLPDVKKSALLQEVGSILQAANYINEAEGVWESSLSLIPKSSDEGRIATLGLITDALLDQSRFREGFELLQSTLKNYNAGQMKLTAHDLVSIYLQSARYAEASRNYQAAGRFYEEACAVKVPRTLTFTPYNPNLGNQSSYVSVARVSDREINSRIEYARFSFRTKQVDRGKSLMKHAEELMKNLGREDKLRASILRGNIEKSYKEWKELPSYEVKDYAPEVLGLSSSTIYSVTHLPTDELGVR